MVLVFELMSWRAWHKQQIQQKLTESQQILFWLRPNWACVGVVVAVNVNDAAP